MADELKPWADRNGHVLGQTRKTGRGGHQLLLYRHPVDYSNGEPDEVDVMAVIRGQVIDIRCEICGETRTWAPGRELQSAVRAERQTLRRSLE
jgi:hypothetical protein